MTLTAAHAERSTLAGLRAHLLMQIDPDRTGELCTYLAGVPGVIATAATTDARRRTHAGPGPANA